MFQIHRQASFYFQLYFLNRVNLTILYVWEDQGIEIHFQLYFLNRVNLTILYVWEDQGIEILSSCCVPDRNRQI
jgi:ferredoxin